MQVPLRDLQSHHKCSGILFRSAGTTHMSSSVVLLLDQNIRPNKDREVSWQSVQRCCNRGHLEPCEELIGVLVLAHIGGLPVVVLEGHPEAPRHKERPVAQCQVPECILHCKSAHQGVTQAVLVYGVADIVKEASSLQDKSSIENGVQSRQASPPTCRSHCLPISCTARTHLQMEEHRVFAVLWRRLLGAQHQRPDGRLHE